MPLVDALKVAEEIELQVELLLPKRLFGIDNPDAIAKFLDLIADISVLSCTLLKNHIRLDEGARCFNNMMFKTVVLQMKRLLLI